MDWHVNGKCEHGHEQVGPIPCKDRTCPQCVEFVYIEERTVKISARVITALRRKLGKQIVFVRLQPGVDKVGVGGYYGRRPRAHEIAERAGLVGGACLTHPNGGVDPAYFYIGLADSIDWKERPDNKWEVSVVNSFSEDDLREDEDYLEFVEAVKEQVALIQWSSDSDKKNAISWTGEMADGKFNTKGGYLNREKRRIVAVTGYQGENSDTEKSIEFPVRSSETSSKCPVDGCDGSYYQIHNFDLLLEHASFGQYEYFRTLVAYQWYCGLIEPPPGLISPSSGSEYEELLEELLEQEGYPTAPRNPLPAEVREKASAS